MKFEGWIDVSQHETLGVDAQRNNLCVEYVSVTPGSSIVMSDNLTTFLGCYTTADGLILELNGGEFRLGSNATVLNGKAYVKTSSSYSLPNVTKIPEMYDVFGDDVTFKICELNCDNYIKFLEEETAEYQRKVDALPEYNANNKKRDEYINNININKKRIEETTKLKEEKGNIIPLSGAMFMLYGDEIVYLFSGSYEDVMSFCGQYRLQWEIIKYAADNGYKRYNFYGINDVFNPNGKDYGVYLFKKGFNGYD